MSRLRLFKFLACFVLAIENLHHAHAGNVFLEEGVDARDGGANAAVGVADKFAEEIGDAQDEGQNGKRVEGQPPVDGKKPHRQDDQQEEIVDHGDDTSGEQDR